MIEYDDSPSRFEELRAKTSVAERSSARGMMAYAVAIMVTSLLAISIEDLSFKLAISLITILIAVGIGGQVAIAIQAARLRGYLDHHDDLLKARIAAKSASTSPFTG